jgi:hypothetical protein
MLILLYILGYLFIGFIVVSVCVYNANIRRFDDEGVVFITMVWIFWPIAIFLFIFRTYFLWLSELKVERKKCEHKKLDNNCIIV